MAMRLRGRCWKQMKWHVHNLRISGISLCWALGYKTMFLPWKLYKNTCATLPNFRFFSDRTMDLEKPNACWIHNGVRVPQRWWSQTNSIQVIFSSTKCRRILKNQHHSWPTDTPPPMFWLHLRNCIMKALFWCCSGFLGQKLLWNFVAKACNAQGPRSCASVFLSTNHCGDTPLCVHRSCLLWTLWSLWIDGLCWCCDIIDIILKLIRQPAQ